jgi:Zn-dependent membrane protease YugP
VNKVLRLSEPVYSSESLAAVAIAAHEAGHAIQHKEGNLVMVFRLSLVPAVGFASNLAFPLFFIGFIFGNPILMKFAIVLFGLVVLFHLVTIFVEYDASAKAKKILVEEGLIYEDEYPAVKKLLDAAALTYVAALFVALAHLLRLLLLARMRERD